MRYQNIEQQSQHAQPSDHNALGEVLLQHLRANRQHNITEASGGKTSARTTARSLTQTRKQFEEGRPETKHSRTEEQHQSRPNKQLTTVRGWSHRMAGALLIASLYLVRSTPYHQPASTTAKEEREW